MKQFPHTPRTNAIPAFFLALLLGLFAFHNAASAETDCQKCEKQLLEHSRLTMERVQLIVEMNSTGKVSRAQQARLDLLELDLKILTPKLAACAPCQKKGEEGEQLASGTSPAISVSSAAEKGDIYEYSKALGREIESILENNACDACRSEKEALEVAEKKYAGLKKRIDRLRAKPDEERALLQDELASLYSEAGEQYRRTNRLRNELYKCVVEKCLTSNTFPQGSMSSTLHGSSLVIRFGSLPLYALFVKARCPEKECVVIAQEINDWLLDTYASYIALPTELHNSLVESIFGDEQNYESMTDAERSAAGEKLYRATRKMERERFEEFMNAYREKKALLEDCDRRRCKLNEDAAAGNEDEKPATCLEQGEAMMGSVRESVVVGDSEGIGDNSSNGAKNEADESAQPPDCEKPPGDKPVEDGIGVKPKPSKPLSTGGAYDSSDLLFNDCVDYVFEPAFEDKLWSIGVQWKPDSALDYCWQPPQGGTTDERTLFHFPIDWQLGWAPQYLQGRGEKRFQLFSRFPMPSDPHFSKRNNLSDNLEDMWGLKRIGLIDTTRGKNRKKIESDGNEVIVAVIDSGLDAEHPDLQGMVWTNPGEVANNQLDDDGNGLVDDIMGWNFLQNNNDTSDTSGHGTLVAGIFAARSNNGIGIAGINPWARILPVKVTNYHGVGSSADVAAAVSYATRMGARVINISLGGNAFSAAELAAIEFAQEQDVLVVVAAGNDGANAAEFWPAGLENVITVAALGPNDKRSAYSNWGAPIDIAAPGSNILSLRARQTDAMMFADKAYALGSHIIGEERFLYQATGTSFAAPFVTGAASLIRSLQPELTAEQVRRKLLQSATDIETLGVDTLTGYGLLNVQEAIDNSADFFIEAAIVGARPNQESGELKVEFVGTADASQFKAATLELGEGKTPKSWRRLGGTLKRSVVNDVLAEISASELRSSPRWTIRLRVTHKDGRERAARFELALQ